MMNSSNIVGQLVRLLTVGRRVGLHGVMGRPPEVLVGALPGELGLYVHVPFCQRICQFCPYNRVLLDDGLASAYRAALAKEIELCRPALQGTRVTSLYIGGGTPTLLPGLIPELAALGAELGASGEMGVEVLPDHATPETLRSLRAAGINFVSLGVQSFDDDVLRYLGRSHDARTARTAIENAMGAGFDCVDVDLVFDVVRFDPRGVVDDARRAFEMGAHQLSVYPMMRFGYTPIGQKGKIHDERAEKNALAEIEVAAKLRGYDRTSVWTFNRNPETRYTSITREHYLGRWPGAPPGVAGARTS